MQTLFLPSLPRPPPPHTPCLCSLCWVSFVIQVSALIILLKGYLYWCQVHLGDIHLVFRYFVTEKKKKVSSLGVTAWYLCLNLEQ